MEENLQLEETQRTNQQAQDIVPHDPNNSQDTPGGNTLFGNARDNTPVEYAPETSVGVVEVSSVITDPPTVDYYGSSGDIAAFGRDIAVGTSSNFEVNFSPVERVANSLEVPQFDTPTGNSEDPVTDTVEEEPATPLPLAPEQPVSPEEPKEPEPEEPKPKDSKPEDPEPEDPELPEDPEDPEEPDPEEPEDPDPEEPEDPEEPDPEEPEKPDPEEPEDPDEPDPEEPEEPEGPDPEEPEDPQEPSGQNPGNNKDVGNSPFDGITGNSGNNGDKTPSGKPMDGGEGDTGEQPGWKGDGPSDSNGRGSKQDVSSLIDSLLDQPPEDSDIPTHDIVDDFHGQNVTHDFDFPEIPHYDHDFHHVDFDFPIDS